MNYTHIVALTMIPCIVIKITTSAAMAILTTCSADLITPEKRKMLMFSSAIWARTWFLWAPFLGTVSSYGMLVPLTIFAIMSVLGGGLFLIIDNFSKQKRTKSNIQDIVLEKGKLIFEYFVRFVSSNTFSLISETFLTKWSENNRICITFIKYLTFFTR